MAKGDEETRRQIPPGAIESEESQSPPGSDDAATKEATQLSQGLSARDLKKEAAEGEHRRSEVFKDQFELIALITLWVLFLAFTGLAGVWLFHLILPTASAIPVHGWLTDDQLDKVEGILAGGIIAGLVADHFKRRMG